MGLPMRFFLVLAYLFGLSVAHAEETQAPDVALLGRMLSAYEKGDIDAPDYYSATSADVRAYYLMAYTWNAGIPAEKKREQAERLYDDLMARANTNGSCIGWGLGVELDAFGDGSVNPADTIYLYTTARVTRALIEAHDAGLINVPEETYRKIACSFKTLFHFDAKEPRLQYSDNANDAGYLVYNTVADLADAVTRLSNKLQDNDLPAMATQACGLLVERTHDNGYLPYFEGHTSTDPTHHAMALNGLILCQGRYGTNAKATHAALSFLREKYFTETTYVPGPNDPEWAAGEALIALTDLCKTESEACAMKAQVLQYVREHEKEGYVSNKAARFQSWLAAGIAYATHKP